MANRFEYGLSPWKMLKAYQPIPMQLADAYQAQVGGSDVDVGVGDPVTYVDTGTVALAAGAEGTPDPIFGVIVAVHQYFDGTRIQRGDVVPGASTGGGIYDRRSEVLVLPGSHAWWRVHVDEAATATTRAAYQAFINENTDLTLTRTSVNGKWRANPKLDISAHATTAGMQVRLMEISLSKHNKNFDETNIDLIVAINEGQEAGQAATTIAGV